VIRLDEVGLEMTILERERERVGVAPIVEKMVENRLKVVWGIRHIERRHVDYVLSRSDGG